jgi:hypothetical protein
MKLNGILVCMIMLGFNLFGQEGLEGIKLEKYYVSTKKDNGKKHLSGELPVGSTTYRMYVDLAPGYRFIAAFGSPGHPLEIRSTQNIYNHVENGATYPIRIPERTYKKNIVALDSWVTVGPAGENYLGVLKEADTLKDFGTVVPFERGFLESDKNEMGYPLRERDGFLRSEHIPDITLYNIDSNLRVLGMETIGKTFRIENGAWASMGKGVCGVDSLGSNTVLIAQITTKGELSYELNFLIGTPDGKTIKYVAKDAVENERIHPALLSTH